MIARARTRSLLMALLFATCPAFAADDGRPRGTNCDLEKPPAGAGESFNHGVTLYVYPRAGDLPTTYSGCQTMWAPKGNQWGIVVMSEYIDGDPVRLWAPEGIPPSAAACRYRKGQVVAGNPETCPIPMSLTLVSVAPGCVEKFKAMKGRSTFPPGCEFDIPAQQLEQLRNDPRAKAPPPKS